jgi:hypothetical protein
MVVVEWRPLATMLAQSSRCGKKKAAYISWVDAVSSGSSREVVVVRRRILARGI